MTDQEINEAVARKLGWKPDTCKCWPGHTVHCEIAPKDYCHSIAAAWGIVEEIKAETLFELCWHDGAWHCYVEYEERSNRIHKEADTAPMAICLAFLKLDQAPAK